MLEFAYLQNFNSRSPEESDFFLKNKLTLDNNFNSRSPEESDFFNLADTVISINFNSRSPEESDKKCKD